jgi:exopolyphosphatase / guanosine-5'-triphosphate,3'-diphosphate pyrophosphatase
MIFATVDIGSNAGRLLIAHVFEKNNLFLTSKIALVRVPLRLGAEVFKYAKISDEKIDMLINTFKAFKLITDIYKPQDFIACATAAFRDATNKDYVLKVIRDETNVDLLIIDPKEEATIISSASNIYIKKKFEDTLYIDVGGGSTDCAYYQKEKFIESKSFNIGTIRYLFDNVEYCEWEELKNWLNEIRKSNGQINCICSGGNISNITKIFGNSNNTIDRTQLKNAVGELEKYSYEERIEKFSLKPDRADVIIPAAKIYNNIMGWGKIDYLVAPRIGLVDGLAVGLYKKYISQ